MKIYFGFISSIPALPEAISLRAATVHLSISLFILSPEPGEICLARTEAAIVNFKPIWYIFNAIFYSYSSHDY